MPPSDGESLVVQALSSRLGANRMAHAGLSQRQAWACQLLRKASITLAET